MNNLVWQNAFWKSQKLKVKHKDIAIAVYC